MWKYFLLLALVGAYSFECPPKRRAASRAVQIRREKGQFKVPEGFSPSENKTLLTTWGVWNEVDDVKILQEVICEPAKEDHLALVKLTYKLNSDLGLHFISAVEVILRFYTEAPADVMDLFLDGSGGVVNSDWAITNPYQTSVMRFNITSSRPGRGIYSRIRVYASKLST